MYIFIDDMMVYRNLDHLIAAGLLSEVTMIESDRHLYEGIFTPGGVVEQAAQRMLGGSIYSTPPFHTVMVGQDFDEMRVALESWS